jgi:hypothetical protein
MSNQHVATRRKAKAASAQPPPSPVSAKASLRPSANPSSKLVTKPSAKAKVVLKGSPAGPGTVTNPQTVNANANARVVSLKARAINAAHLCFPVSGVVDQVGVRVGDPVAQVDRNEIVSSMLQFPATGDPSLLDWDADAIANWIGQANQGNGALVRLQQDAAYAALDQAISARANAYFAKYADPNTVVQAMQSTYQAPNNFSTPGLLSKSQHLANLMTYSGQQWTGLKNQYGQVSFTGLTGGPTPLSNPAVVDHTESDITTDQPEVDSETQGVASTQVDEFTVTKANKVNQTIINKDFVFRIPYLEAQAQYERAQLSLADELFQETLRQQTVQNYQQVLMNELNSINLGVFRLQIAYLNGFVLAPFAGIVTGVYKQPGEAVRAGETVIRLEDSSEMYLMATVFYPGLIQGRQPPDTAGMTATITTSLYDAGGAPAQLTAEVLTARGGGADDKWELVLLYQNDGSQGPTLPLDYNFDFDDTTISFA